jgi:predicted nucleic acid-binding protein
MHTVSEANSAPGVVLDTNAALDWLVFGNPAMGPLAAAIQAGDVRWIACPGMRQELAHMLRHASLARWQPDGPQALGTFDAHVHLLDAPCPGPAQRLRCTDPDDQVFVDLALAQRACWLVTNDRAVLKLGRRTRAHGLAILRPADWALEPSCGRATAPQPALGGPAHHTFTAS